MAPAPVTGRDGCDAFGQLSWETWPSPTEEPQQQHPHPAGHVLDAHPEFGGAAAGAASGIPLHSDAQAVLPGLVCPAATGVAMDCPV